MSDDRKPENPEAGMPVEIPGSAPRKKRRWIYYIVAAVVILAGGLAYLYFGGCLFGDRRRGQHGGSARPGRQVHLRHAPVHPHRQAGRLPHLRDDVDEGRERAGARRPGGKSRQFRGRSVGTRRDSFGRRSGRSSSTATR